MQVLTVSAFVDNYIWLITNQTRSHAAIVDPGDARPVLARLKKENLTPIAILITHHHGDHVGGIAGILKQYPDTPVYGPATEFIPHLTIALEEGQTVKLDQLKIELQVIYVPGHTAGHIAYYGENSLFCGGTIFANGCGRVFDGTLKDLYQATHRLAQLPPSTHIYCAHEYTIDNIGFAKWVEPQNLDLLQRQKDCWDLLDNNQSTVPSTLELELKTNPFLRVHIPAVIAKLNKVAGKKLSTPEERFAVMRIWKDTEYD